MSIDTTARGGGYFVIYAAPTPIPKDVTDGEAWLRANATRMTQHRDERECVSECSRILEAVEKGGPRVWPYYVHELVVSVVETSHVTAVPPPPPVPLLPPAAAGADLLEQVNALAPESAADYTIRTDNYWLGLQVSFERSLTRKTPIWHRVIYAKPGPTPGTEIRTKPRVVGVLWRGAVALWGFAQFRLVIQEKQP